MPRWPPVINPGFAMQTSTRLGCSSASSNSFVATSPYKSESAIISSWSLYAYRSGYTHTHSAILFISLGRPNNNIFGMRTGRISRSNAAHIQEPQRSRWFLISLNDGFKSRYCIIMAYFMHDFRRHIH